MPFSKIDPDSMLQFPNGRGPLTLFWHRKHDALSGLWRFAIQHGWTDRSPVPEGESCWASIMLIDYLIGTLRLRTSDTIPHLL
jgi:hypothetical protein